MPTRNVVLAEHLDSFIASGIEEGRYSNANEVVREGPRLLPQRDAKDKARIEGLRGAVNQGIDQIERGEGIDFASIEDLARHIREIGAEASQELAASIVRPSPGTILPHRTTGKSLP
jgi:antitoxin ParD1/3/4